MAAQIVKGKTRVLVVDNTYVDKEFRGQIGIVKDFEDDGSYLYVYFPSLKVSVWVASDDLNIIPA